MSVMSEVLEVLRRVGAIIANTHVVGTSGRHLDTYINKDALYPHTAAASRIGELFAERHARLEIDTVVGPAVGGVILSQWTAHHLSRLKGKEIYGIYAEKTSEGGFMFRRGYLSDVFLKEKNALVVEDLTTTGGSVKKVIDAVRQGGGTVVAVSVMVNRDPERVNAGTIGAPFSALAVLPLASYDPAECPMCKKGVPINTEVGHGKEYTERVGKKE